MPTIRLLSITLISACGAVAARAAEPPPTADQWHVRGSEAFCAGKIEESLEAFDREIALDARRAPWHWKRGISLYYAGRYADGAKQFEGYQTVDGNDVENAVWRFLCQARDPNAGPERARREILVIGDDRRVPMRQIYELFAGKLQPDDVLTAVRAGDPSDDALNTRLFYAHLYLGLYAEVQEDAAAALEHLDAAVEHKIGHYMWDVAKVHADRLRAQK